MRVFGRDVSRNRLSLWRALLAVGAMALFGGAPALAETLPRAGELERVSDRFLERYDTGGAAGTPAAAPAELPESRVVAFYGAPQMGATILGMKSPAAAARRLAKQSRPYRTLGDRPVLGAFDLVSVFATAGGGPDDLYRTRQDPEVIQIYLDQARAVGARLILDIQPGRSTFVEEVEALLPWLAEPDVDVALDPEWNVGRRGIPGRTEGKVRAAEVNAVAAALADVVEANGLPPKLLLVHQFRRGSIRGRTKLRSPEGVQTLLNFDGIGAPGPKAAGYADLAAPPPLFNGFSLFYQRDTPVMKPGAVLALTPEPDFLLYQ